MKTPRQLARTCCRRRCVLPIGLCAATAYLLTLSTGPEPSPPSTGTSATQPAERNSDPEHAGALAKPANNEEREALAHHLASMAAPAKMYDASQAAAALSGAAAHPPAFPDDATRSATEEQHVQHQTGKPEMTGHGGADSPASSLPHVAEAAGTPGAAAVPSVSRASGVKPGPPTSPRVATFYYPWYGTPAVDGKWAHWDHPQIEHWDTKQRDRFPHGEQTRRVPPGSIGSNFYPASGPYSSRDPDVVATHMRQMRQAGIGVVVVSWYPPGTQDAVQGGKELKVEDGVLMPLVRHCRVMQCVPSPSHSFKFC